MNGAALQNATPTIKQASSERETSSKDWDDEICDEVDAREIFDLIRTVKDPEHPHSLEELNVVQEHLITCNDTENYIDIKFTPTIPHCSMATLIGLSLRVKLLHSVSNRFKVDVRVTPGSHQSEEAINKQLGDKERVAAALENPQLLNMVNQCIWSTG
ncbi:cytosolic iron-sulfur assembly component 2B-like [Bolinopsis microptera]|uniref:cytosolic iron-sulfur assembly component 2B-like n=1 Tax=Bolinopsis microptera TaxID=2820187 RepID=UPI003079499F